MDDFLDPPRLTKQSKPRGRDKFKDIQHAWMPASIPVWSDALATVDRTRRPVGKWDYYVPEPGLFVGTKTEECQERYLTNWLLVREAWYYMLENQPNELTQVPPQSWRDLLNSDAASIKILDNGTRTTLRKQEVKALFGRIFSDKDLSDHDGKSEWFGRRVQLPCDAIGRQVLWEIFEMGFRFELLELDRYLCPKADEQSAEPQEWVRESRVAKIFDPNLNLRLHHLPPSHIGLAAKHIRHRLDSLEALRMVIARWPQIPKDIRNGRFASSCSDVTLQDREKKLVEFYTQTFYDVAGRAALVPHLFPL